MALPPSIPTSFVPHPTTSVARTSGSNLSSIFAYVSYILLAIVFVLAIAVFFYGRLLGSVKTSKETALAEATANINTETVTQFVRLHDRLAAGKTLLTDHAALSGFFVVLESVMPSTIRFRSLHISADGKTSKFEGTGVAKSFNALAVASSAFANDSRIKSAIFSGIGLVKDGSVTFTLTAGLDPEVISFTP